MNITLAQWQNSIKPENQLIVQASTEDGMDGITMSSIGMCYHYVLERGNYEKCQIGEHNKLVLCAISSVTDSRRRRYYYKNRATIINTLEKNGIHNVNIEPKLYYSILPNYKFVISPEGNGIDCHRHYEALMAGCIPIVEDGPLVRNKYGNAPILYTNDYSEITPEYLEQKYAEMVNKVWDFSRLFLGFWPPEDQYRIMQRGNYWTMRTLGELWYK
jgi:hypothetical protein